MARYRDLYTPAANYGQVYRSGLQQRVESQEKAGNQMVDFAGEIYDLVERQRKAKAEAAESAALERQRAAQRESWLAQAQSDRDRISLAGEQMKIDRGKLKQGDRRIDLEGKRVKIAGKEVGIREQDSANRAEQLRIERKRVTDLDKRGRLQIGLDTWEAKLNALNKQSDSWILENQINKYGNTKKTIIADYDSKISHITKFKNQGLMSQADALRTLYQTYPEMFPNLDGVAAKTIQDAEAPALAKYSRIATQQEYLRSKIKKGYVEQTNPYKPLILSHIDHPIFGMPDMVKAERQRNKDLQEQVDVKSPESENKIEKSFLLDPETEEIEEEKEEVVPRGTGVFETILKEGVVTPKAGEEAKKAKVSNANIIPQLSKTNPWISDTKDMNKLLAVGEIINAIEYAGNSDGSNPKSVEELGQSFDSFAKMRQHMGAGSEKYNDDPGVLKEKTTEDRQKDYDNAFLEFKNSNTYRKLKKLTESGDKVAGNFIINIEYLLKNSRRLAASKDFRPANITYKKKGYDDMNLGEKADYWRDRIVTGVYGGVKDALVWYGKTHKEIRDYYKGQ